MLTMLRLSLRQIAGSRRIFVALAIAALPMIAAIVFRVTSDQSEAAAFIDVMTTGLLASPLLPLVAVVIGTAAFGNERNDRTLGYLVLTPMPRRSIALAKHLAVVISVAVTLAVAAAGTVLIAGGDSRQLIGTVVGMLIGAIAYGTLFTWLGLASNHALVIGLIYIFVWETLLAGFVAGLATLSVRAYVLTIIAAIRDDGADLHERLTTQAGIIGVVIVSVVAIGLTMWSLRRMDIP